MGIEMSDSDKMRQEFEAWAKSEGFDLSRWMRVENDGKLTPTEYADAETRAAEKAYAAGRKAEREEVESESFETARRCSVCGDWFSSSSQTLHPCPYCKTKPEGER